MNKLISKGEKMLRINSFRISAAICAQFLGLCFLAMSLSLFLSHAEFSNEIERSAYLFDFGLWLLRGFGAMLVSWLAIFSLFHSVHRQQVQTLCVSGMAISTALLTLCCVE